MNKYPKWLEYEPSHLKSYPFKVAVDLEIWKQFVQCSKDAFDVMNGEGKLTDMSFLRKYSDKDDLRSKEYDKAYHKGYDDGVESIKNIMKEL